MEKLKKVISVQLEFYNQRCDFCKFLTWEIWGDQNKFEEHIKEIRLNNTVVIEEIIDQGIKQGEFKQINAETAAVSLNGMINITALHWFMFREEFPMEEIKNDIFNLFLRGFKRKKIKFFV